MAWHGAGAGDAVKGRAVVAEATRLAGSSASRAAPSGRGMPVAGPRRHCNKRRRGTPFARTALVWLAVASTCQPVAAPSVATRNTRKEPNALAPESQRRHCIVWSGGDKRVAFMMQPALQTIAAGFAAEGFVVTSGTGTRLQQERLGLRNQTRSLAQEGAPPLLSDLRARDAFVWIGVWGFNDRFIRSVMAKLRHRGVFTAYYATESHESWDTNCSLLRRLPVHEIWQYTMANTLRCPAARVGKPVRFLPPGVYQLAGTSVQDEGKSLSRSDWAAQDAKNASAGAPPPMMKQIFFMGTNSRFSKPRERCLTMLQRELANASTPPLKLRTRYVGSGGRVKYACFQFDCSPGGSCERACPVRTFGEVATDSSLANVLNRSESLQTVHLNVHKGCDATARKSDAACETFRFAVLLSAGLDVVSEHCHPADERLYEGLVRFEAPVDFLAAITHSGKLDMRRQEKELSQAKIAKRKALFASRFEPSSLFERAGLRHVLRHWENSPSTLAQLHSAAGRL